MPARKSASARAAALTAVGYFILARLTLSLAIPPGVATPIWPASGLALACAFFLGRPALIGIWIGSFAANAGILARKADALSMAVSVTATAAIALGSAAQAGFGAFLLHRFFRTGSPFARALDSIRFVGVAALACLIASTVASLSVALAGYLAWPAFGLHWLTWWLGDVVGVLTLCPALLAPREDLAPLRSGPRALAFLAFAAALAATARLVFLSPDHAAQSLDFLLIPFVVAAAMGFGQPGVTLSALTVSVLAALGAMRGIGRFQGVSRIDVLLMLQGFVACVTVTGAALAAALCERRQARAELERRVEDRTSALAATVQDLKRSNDDLQQFAYVASHDLKEPLRKVAGFVDLLSQRYRGRLDPEADQWIEFAVNGAQRMHDLIDDLLAYSRVGRDTEPVSAVDLNAAAAAAISEAFSQEPGVAVVTGSLPTVNAIPFQMDQLFRNLLSNASKFRSERPLRVELSAARDSAAWRICVSDNGLGIPPEFSEKVFRIFERLHPGQRYPGTGIGLAICKKIVERHGGRIWVEPNPGGGSRFQFVLPAFNG